MSKKYTGWIAVDLDGTLATWDHWRGVKHIGKPIKSMVERVKRWRKLGIEIRIFTARAANYDSLDKHRQKDALTPIQRWCKKHLGEVLPVTNVKDMGMVELWDDRAVQVETNTGRLLGEAINREHDLKEFGRLKKEDFRDGLRH